MDPSASAVLGYSWLTQYNLLIDWVTQELKFRTPENEILSVDAASSMSVHTPPELSPRTPQPPASDVLPDSQPPPPEPTAALRAAATKISVLVINAYAVGLLSQLLHCHPSSIVCSGFIRPLSTSARATNVTFNSTPSDPALAAELDELCPKVPKHYQDRVYAFSKRKGTTLPPRRSYDHKIETDEGTSPPYRPIYSLSEVEQLAL